MASRSVRRKPIVLAAASAATAFLLPSTFVHGAWSVFDKDIPDLETAYQSSLTTVQDVVQQYLDRIKAYNKNGGGDGTLGTGGRGINAVGYVNPSALSDAAAVQTLINNGATTGQYPLLGVPVLVKDSYDATGMPTTNGVSVLNGSGTAGSTTLMPPTDSFAVAQLKAAGAIIIGKASMSTMAYSFDGIDNAHGVVENPYNPLRQPGGSSSGTGAGVASQFAMIGMGGETGGSIRVPSNANDDVGLKTSVGLIDPGGTWPLTPSRDVVGPIARDVTDIAYAMNALVGPSSTNLWNGTPYYSTNNPGTVRPTNYTSFLSTNALQGKVLAVPKDMVMTSNTSGTAFDGTISPLVLAQFNQAVADLKAQGATVVYVDIPATVTYYNTIGKSGSGATTTGFPYPYPTTTVGGTTPSSTWSSNAAAYYYEKQIESYHDPVIHTLRDFANALNAGKGGLSGSAFSSLTSAFNNINTLATIWENGAAAGFADANNDGIPDNPDAIKALQAFTSLRADQFDSFMNHPNLVDDPTTPDVDESKITQIDAFVAPDYGTVMPYVTSALRPPGTPADPYASGSASLMGRFEGNIMGLPALAVPMGFFPDGTPMDLQFFDQLDQEGKLLGFGYDYEQATEWHADPNLSFLPEPASCGVIIVAGGALVLRRRRAMRT
jgi:amidase